MIFLTGLRLGGALSYSGVTQVCHTVGDRGGTTRAFGPKVAGMSVTSQVFRRGAVYTWRRRIPAGDCQGADHAFRPLAARGRSATMTEEDRASLAREGMGGRFERLLPIYAQDFWSEGRMNRLRREITEAAGLPTPTLPDLQRARRAALKGRAAALIQRSLGRQGEDVQAEIDLAGRLAGDAVGELTAETSGSTALVGTCAPTPLRADGAEVPSGPLPAASAISSSLGNPSDPKLEPIATNVPLSDTTYLTQSDDLLGSLFSPLIRDVAERLAKAKSLEEVEPRLLRPIAMVADLVLDLTGIEDITLLRRPHLARFREAVHLAPKNWGKSLRDRERSLIEIIRDPAGAEGDERGLAPATVNRNLGVQSQILDRARSGGLAVDSNLKPESLRAKIGKRARNARPGLTREDVLALFQHPVWTGWKSRTRPMLPGATVIHDGLYGVPLIGAYTGARREGIAGLAVSDVVKAEEDGGGFLHIRFTDSRRIKNLASDRRVPIHPHLLELGLLDHIEARRQKDCDLSPDLRPSNPKDTYGDGADDSFRKIR